MENEYQSNEYRLTEKEKKLEKIYESPSFWVFIGLYFLLLLCVLILPDLIPSIKEKVLIYPLIRLFIPLFLIIISVGLSYKFGLMSSKKILHFLDQRIKKLENNPTSTLDSELEKITKIITASENRQLKEIEKIISFRLNELSDGLIKKNTISQSNLLIKITKLISTKDKDADKKFFK